MMEMKLARRHVDGLVDQVQRRVRRMMAPMGWIAKTDSFPVGCNLSIYLHWRLARMMHQSIDSYFYWRWGTRGAFTPTSAGGV